MSDATVCLATGPVSWGVDFADAPGNPAWEAVLDAIAVAGYGATELGPLGYLPEDPDQLSSELDRRGLAVAGSFLFQPLHDPRKLEEVLEVARRTCAAIAAVGGRYLVVIDEVSPARAATAGRADAALRLAGEDQRALLQAVRAIARLASEAYGLRAVVHNHVGGYLEFADELEAMLDAVEPELLGLCVDTGHAAYAGIDPVEFVDRHRDRVEYLHLKDIDGEVLMKVRWEPLDFWAAIGAGVFCPLGRGVVDFPALAAVLRESGFDGWATVEQDRDSDAGDPIADVIASREYLEQIGMARPRKVGRDGD